MSGKSTNTGVKMTIKQKQDNRLMFRLMAFFMVVLVTILGAILSYVDKGDSFGVIATGVFVFAGSVFGADYFSRPSNNEEKR